MNPDAPPSESLAARIKDAERHLLERRRSVGVHGNMLGRRIHERITSPAVLSSAVGLGFLLGSRRTQDPESDHSWLRMAVGSVPWMNPLLAVVKSGPPTQVPSSPPLE
ncbi:hypothetical protein [Ectothiorhodospira lacustris]|uniref:hypothetical protein n=1 Tax=Ectothiorhodospira lacustris TaxID=2899127 RepID=UPI001EE939CA|nr:hypothetical protein [Ectothiorhodospira lacustris]MCG5502088.1 hypothetical protein [Ectothiorhodospira lacustris]MCG5508817.1 hypothetical protein [Ectothiorhodospira lacustris]MCG5520608.1 hypothetical protein [Ectothiorhodospira lacustris]